MLTVGTNIEQLSPCAGLTGWGFVPGGGAPERRHLLSSEAASDASASTWGAGVWGRAEDPSPCCWRDLDFAFL